MVFKLLVGLAVLLGMCQGTTGQIPLRSASTPRKPNFILIMTDDQDLHLDSLDYQPAVKKHFSDQGTWFKRHYCTISICCPSRVSFLTGKAAHNTNVTDVSPPYGGYTKFIAEGLNDNYLPVWLQSAGYNTFYTGKLMNGHSTSTYNKPFPKGWTGTNFLIDPGTYVFYNSTSQRNKEAPRNNLGLYSTDMIAEDAVGFLEEAHAEDKPFFLGVAPIGPHSETVPGAVSGLNGTAFYPPVPADRHKNLFPDAKTPRTPNFNPDSASGASWIKTLEKLNSSSIEYMDNFYRRRVQSLQAVDELVGDVMSWLHAHPDLLDNTYVIYTTDNGYHIGNHRMAPGKTCGIEEDINIPFFVRGPGVAKGQVVDFPTSHTDVVPTIFQLAGIPLRDDFDGEPFPVTASQIDKSATGGEGPRSEHVNVEFWGDNILEGAYVGAGSGLIKAPGYTIGGYAGANNTYKAVRVIGESYNLFYSVWCTNEHELYDMEADPHQMHNLFDTANSTAAGARVAGWTADRLAQRLDTLLLTLKACKGQTCTRPWQAVHPTGGVNSLREAMDAQFDAFYADQQPRVAFSRCELGYIAEAEGPMEPNVFGGQKSSGRWARWEDWV